MGCDFPIKAYRTDQVGESGKRLITFNPLHGLNSASPFLIPCNNCVGCRLERSRQWSVRMTHESKLHKHNCFLTLTYDNQHIPENFGLDLRHWQLFMKKLRRYNDHRMSFFAVGEYGDENGRPHYHAIIFGHDFPDKKKWSVNQQGDPIYNSETLSKIWGKGHATTQDVTPGSTAYVARYCVKKLNLENKPDKYYRFSPVTGAFYHVRPEFAVMSRNPSIGRDFVINNRNDITQGTVVKDGQIQSIPKYYQQYLSDEEKEAITRRARRALLKHKSDQTTERRWARVVARDDRISRLKRGL